MNQHRYTHVPSLLTFLPPPTPLGCHRALGLSSLCETANSHWLSTLHMVVYFFQCSSLNLSHPLLPQCVCKSALYICISVAPLQIDSSVPCYTFEKKYSKREREGKDTLKKKKKKGNLLSFVPSFPNLL